MRVVNVVALVLILAFKLLSRIKLLVLLIFTLSLLIAIPVLVILFLSIIVFIRPLLILLASLLVISLSSVLIIILAVEALVLRMDMLSVGSHIISAELRWINESLIILDTPFVQVVLLIFLHLLGLFILSPFLVFALRSMLFLILFVFLVGLLLFTLALLFVSILQLLFDKFFVDSCHIWSHGTEGF